MRVRVVCVLGFPSRGVLSLSVVGLPPEGGVGAAASKVAARFSKPQGGKKQTRALLLTLLVEHAAVQLVELFCFVVLLWVLLV